MGVLINRVFPPFAILFTLAAHYWLLLPWTEAVVAGCVAGLFWYIAWELRNTRAEVSRWGRLFHKFSKHQTGGRNLEPMDFDQV